MNKIVWFIFLNLILPSCGIRNYFQPIPPRFQQYKRTGASIDDVKNDLLKCGYDNIYTTYKRDRILTVDERAGNQLCMIKKGYIWIYGRILCEQSAYKNLRACHEQKKGSGTFFGKN